MEPKVIYCDATVGYRGINLVDTLRYEAVQYRALPLLILSSRITQPWQNWRDVFQISLTHTWSLAQGRKNLLSLWVHDMMDQNRESPKPPWEKAMCPLVPLSALMQRPRPKRNLIRKCVPLALHPTLLLGNPAADQEALGYAGRTYASRCLLTSDGGVLKLLHAVSSRILNPSE
ncbi:hypothetical protein FPOAC2_11315 [Fusarium poae]